MVRVHPELLARQKLPPSLMGKESGSIASRTSAVSSAILRAMEQLVLKFFLHISREEQRQRLLARLDEPAKRWKFSAGDIAERKLWDKYMAAYEDAIRATSRDEAPWYVVPADNKPFARLVVARAIVDALSRLDLKYPKVDAAALKEMQKIKATLLEEGPSKRIESSQLRPNCFMGGGPLERRAGAPAHHPGGNLRPKPIFRYKTGGPT